MKGRGITERVIIRSQKKELEMNGNDAMEWNERIGTEMDKSVIEVCERKNEMGMDGNGCIKNMDANENEKQGCVVMRVMEVK